MACGYAPVDTAYLSGILGYVDCQAQTIGAQGYLALAAPGSVASLILTALLTILVALFGYRLLLGNTPTLGETTLTLVKIGIVVALATGWQGYRTLFYDTALHGPAELAATIGAPVGLPGANGGLVAQLDLVDQQYQALAIAVARPLAFRPQLGPPPLFQGFDTFALGASRVAFLVGTVGALAAVRLIAGLLLALGPLFVAFLLFDGTRGLFEGWLRVLAGAALGALATTITLGVELALLEPWLADLLARAAAGDPILGAPAQLLATSLIFDIALLAMIGAASRVAWGLRLPGRSLAVSRETSASDRTREIVAGADGRRSAMVESRSRSAAVVDAIAASERREAIAGATGDALGGSSAVVRMPASLPAGPATAATGSLDPAARRRTGTRVSASAGRRDRAG